MPTFTTKGVPADVCVTTQSTDDSNFVAFFKLQFHDGDASTWRRRVPRRLGSTFPFVLVLDDEHEHEERGWPRNSL